MRCKIFVSFIGLAALIYRKQVIATNEFEKMREGCTSIVYRFLLSMCGNEDLAEELTSETFYQAYLHIDKFSPIVFEVEPGTYNLTSKDLRTSAEEIGQYVFYTNYSQIEVTVQGDDSFQGTIMLWNAANSSSFIQIHDVRSKEPSCIFTGLSSSNRYQISCDNLNGVEITVSEGRTISFWNSLKSVLSDIIGAMGR